MLWFRLPAQTNDNTTQMRDSLSLSHTTLTLTQHSPPSNPSSSSPANPSSPTTNSILTDGELHRSSLYASWTHHRLSKDLFFTNQVGLRTKIFCLPSSEIEIEIWVWNWYGQVRAFRIRDFIISKLGLFKKIRDLGFEKLGILVFEKLGIRAFRKIRNFRSRDFRIRN